MGPDGGTGYAERNAVDVSRLDAAAVGREAARTARDMADPVELPPGDYPVVLEPYAVVDIVDMLGYLGFSALAVQEERSFFEAGRRIGSPLITLVDDASDDAGTPASFDYEGVPTQRVTLLDAGVCRDVVHDAQTAARDGVASTGHGLPAPNPWGPFPLHMVMAAGTTPREELVAGLERGLLVTRFHYTNVIHPKQAIITGMTRDGLFLVEGGRIVGPVRNLRFTQGYLDALDRVEAVSAERIAVEGFLGTAVVPALRIGELLLHGRDRALNEPNRVREQVGDAIRVEGGDLSGARRVLANPRFMALFASQILTQVGGNMVLFGLTVEVFSLTHSSTSVSILLLTFLVPAVVFGAIAGVFVDRFDRRWILIGTNMARGALFLSLAFLPEQLWIIYIVTAIVATLTTFFAPAEAAMIPFVVKHEQLMTANGLFILGAAGVVRTRLRGPRTPRPEHPRHPGPHHHRGRGVRASGPPVRVAAIRATDRRAVQDAPLRRVGGRFDDVAAARGARLHPPPPEHRLVAQPTSRSRRRSSASSASSGPTSRSASSGSERTTSSSSSCRSGSAS